MTDTNSHQTHTARWTCHRPAPCSEPHAAAAPCGRPRLQEQEPTDRPRPRARSTRNTRFGLQVQRPLGAGLSAATKASRANPAPGPIALHCIAPARPDEGQQGKGTSARGRYSLAARQKNPAPSRALGARLGHPSRRPGLAAASACSHLPPRRRRTPAPHRTSRVPRRRCRKPHSRRAHERGHHLRLDPIGATQTRAVRSRAAAPPVKPRWTRRRRRR